MFIQSCLLSVLLLYVDANFTSKWHRALFFPSALRVRRSSPEFLDPILQMSLPEVELLYEFLTTGVNIDKDDRLTLRDPELSSLKKATTFDVVCNDVIPKSISEIQRLGDKLSHISGPLNRADFERTLLTMAYGALKTSQSDNSNQQKFWMQTLTKLFIALRRDLMFPYNKEGHH
ncbi:protein FAM180A isoform X1 [Bufo gargarizans]|uniref:protein FAM180A isoform X1 n=1 Tax=Bufo gargarizans TaxID=30331 RepID=UPI001CF305E7|nr:protein FAM180A isoform X1 [Bufo gargarizans]